MKQYRGHIVPNLREQDVIVKSEHRIDDIQYSLWNLVRSLREKETDAVFTSAIDECVSNLQSAHNVLSRIVPVTNVIDRILLGSEGEDE